MWMYREKGSGEWSACIGRFEEKGYVVFVFFFSFLAFSVFFLFSDCFWSLILLVLFC